MAPFGKNPEAELINRAEAEEPSLKLIKICALSCGSRLSFRKLPPEA